MYKRILIATDGSELAMKGLQKGLELAAQLGARVDIVTVSEPWAVGMYDAMGWSAGYEASPEYKQDREAAAQKILQPSLDAARAAGVAEVIGHHVLDRYAADGIIETADACGSDLLVMTSHGRRGMTRVLLGSQTAEVLARSKVPVLVIR
ncbi:MAG: universal stress protein UspA [Lysobacteraceae bacterium SCN 69-123]|jgi:nucleotide-binding universal stress UspA family protein|uniref:universal stress protein n=1 Tax=Stenotrophomonas acidaminiphila TaxID=128780 RepID=UPI00086CA599|nr:universal stress protein [Stenotrophomonas acidaminiphila]MBN8800297.1 universal stress protein [Stenotrophomonas acidaminiphila]MDF9440533.1 universal stress protein [Stenotrophomonas acidaminiphila]ODU46993.1 MAG: universal stress protein UspA [Xanthomonadaceae bacterium SCN 69-123]OJY72779.1 MAG: universal stress protein UspA [Stenotrophomonas sp. 69-14]